MHLKFNMTPPCSVFDSAYLRCANIVKSGNINSTFAIFNSFKNIGNFRVVQFRPRSKFSPQNFFRILSYIMIVSFRNLFWMGDRGVIISPATITSALRFHVNSILHFSSYPKVFGINANWIIASMKNTEAIRNFSEMQYPRNSMSELRFFAELKLTVFTISFSTRPLPAFSQIWGMRHDISVFINLLKKPLLDCFESLKVIVASGLNLWKNGISVYNHINIMVSSVSRFPVLNTLANGVFIFSFLTMYVNRGVN